MLFYFHFFYSFPFNVISVATVICFCGFHPPVVSTVVSTLWFHTLCGYSVVCTLLLFASSCGYSWCPFHGLHFRGLHSAVVSTLPWFASLCGSHPPCGYSVVSLLWFALSSGLHSAMVSTLPWFASSRGSHPPCGYSVVSLLWFAPSRGLHSAVVSTLPWFASSHGSHPLVVTLWCPSWILA